MFGASTKLLVAYLPYPLKSIHRLVWVALILVVCCCLFRVIASHLDSFIDMFHVLKVVAILELFWVVDGLGEQFCAKGSYVAVLAKKPGKKKNKKTLQSCQALVCTANFVLI